MGDRAQKPWLRLEIVEIRKQTEAASTQQHQILLQDQPWRKIVMAGEL